MLRSEIIEKLKEALTLVTGETECGNFTEESRLVEDLGLNSIGLLYIVVALEELFSITFEDVGVSDFITVKDVANYIDKKVNS